MNMINKIQKYATGTKEDKYKTKTSLAHEMSGCL